MGFEINAPPRILVADDAPDIRSLVGTALRQAGFDVAEAADGFEALAAIANHPPDLLLLDMLMPGRTGMEVCAILKSRPETAAIPVIFLTGVNESRMIVQAFTTGASDYVTKPFRIPELVARVSFHIRLHQAERQLVEKNGQMASMARRLAEVNAELALANRLDAMTQLLNRGAWQEAAASEHDRFQRFGDCYGLAMLDVDHFKVYNDTHGHVAGDQCLRRVAHCIASACRRMDHVGRFGGEEFVVLAPQMDGDGIRSLAERIRRAIWNLNLAHPAGGVADRVTVSVGCAVADGRPLEEVIKSADSALYVAKRSGRNRVSLSAETGFVNGTRAVTIDDPTSRSPDTAGRRSRVTVLLADAETERRTSRKRHLQSQGYRVWAVGDGPGVIERIRQSLPEVIVLDMDLPGLDGLTCAVQLKSETRTTTIPILLLGGNDEPLESKACLETGIEEYAVRPLSNLELSMRVSSMVQSRRDRQELLVSFDQRGEQARVLSSLLDFCRTVGRITDVGEVLDQTLTLAADITSCRCISILMPDSSGRELVVARTYGFEPPLEADLRFPIEMGIPGHVFARRETVVINQPRDSATGEADLLSPVFKGVPLVSAVLDTSDTTVGVLNVSDRSEGRPFQYGEVDYIELMANIAASAIHDLQTRQAHEQACDSIVVAMAKLAEFRDNDTGRHLERVTRYSTLLAEQLRYSTSMSQRIDDPFLAHLDRAVSLHDIGKVAVPDSILLKPGRLSPEEMRVMRRHAEIGAETIRAVRQRLPQVGFLQMAEEIAQSHHEWFDGSGYPEGLEGEAIPLAARIVAIADVYDALTSRRVYKEPMSHESAVRIIVDASGTQFDPTVVEAFRVRQYDFAHFAQELADDGRAWLTVSPSTDSPASVHEAALATMT